MFNIPPWEFTCINSSLMKLIYILQCFPAFFPIIKELCLVTFYLISFVAFTSNDLWRSHIQGQRIGINNLSHFKNQFKLTQHKVILSTSRYTYSMDLKWAFTHLAFWPNVSYYCLRQYAVRDAIYNIYKCPVYFPPILVIFWERKDLTYAPIMYSLTKY